MAVMMLYQNHVPTVFLQYLKLNFSTRVTLDACLGKEHDPWFSKNPNALDKMYVILKENFGPGR